MAASKSHGGISFGLSFILGLLWYAFAFVPYWITYSDASVDYYYGPFMVCAKSSSASACVSNIASSTDILFQLSRAAISIGSILGFISFIMHMVWLCSSSPSKGVTVGAAACTLCQGICGVLAVALFLAFFTVEGLKLLGFAIYIFLVLSIILMIVASIFVHITRNAPDSPQTQGMVLGQYPQAQAGYPNQAYAGQQTQMAYGRA